MCFSLMVSNIKKSYPVLLCVVLSYGKNDDGDAPGSTNPLYRGTVKILPVKFAQLSASLTDHLKEEEKREEREQKEGEEKEKEQEAKEKLEKQEKEQKEREEKEKKEQEAKE